MKAVVAAFNQEKALVGAFSVNTNLRMELFGALVPGDRQQEAEEGGEGPDGGADAVQQDLPGPLPPHRLADDHHAVGGHQRDHGLHGQHLHTGGLQHRPQPRTHPRLRGAAGNQ